MQHVPGATIPVPDALSRRVDHPLYTPREGVDATNAGTHRSAVDPVHGNGNGLVHLMDSQTLPFMAASVQWLGVTTRAQAAPTLASPPLATETHRSPVPPDPPTDAGTDSNDWRLCLDRFLQLEMEFGPFTLDACCGDQGVNKQRTIPAYMRPQRSCLANEQSFV